MTPLGCDGCFGPRGWGTLIASVLAALIGLEVTPASSSVVEWTTHKKADEVVSLGSNQTRGPGSITSPLALL
jgi:hypothetical protein